MLLRVAGIGLPGILDFLNGRFFLKGYKNSGKMAVGHRHADALGGDGREEVAGTISVSVSVPQIFSGSRSLFSSSPPMNGMTLSTISGQVSKFLPAPEMA